MTSYTVTRLIDNETQDALRSALVCTCLELRPVDGSTAIVRVDPAPGFVALRNDPVLSQNHISIELVAPRIPTRILLLNEPFKN